MGCFETATSKLLAAIGNCIACMHKIDYECCNLSSNLRLQKFSLNAKVIFQFIEEHKSNSSSILNGHPFLWYEHTV